MIDIFELYKKENFVLATVCIRREKICDCIEIRELEFDLFYKEDNGFTRFSWFGNEFYAGDNSDGKGQFCNIIPAWEYYTKEDLDIIQNQYGEICVVKRTYGLDGKPILQKYAEDYKELPVF